MLLTNNDVEKTFDEKYYMSDYFPWADFVDGYFVQVDGSMGKIWELKPAETELASEGVMNDLSTTISALINRLPQELHCQLILLCDSEVETTLANYKKAGANNNDEIISTIIDEKVLHIENSKDGFFAKSRDNFYPRRIRILFTIRYFPPGFKASIKDKLSTLFVNSNALRERLAKDWETHKKYLQKPCEYIENSLSSMNIPFVSMNDGELIQTLYRLLNPKRAKNIPMARIREDFIRDQILFTTPQAIGEGFILDGYHTRVVSLKELPQHTFTGMFSAETGKGDRFCLLDILKDFMFVINFVVPDQGQAIERLKWQKTFAGWQQVSQGGNTNEEAIEKRQELSSVIAETFKSGQAIVNARIHFVLKAETEEAVDAATNTLINVLNRLGADGLKEDKIGDTLFLTCLPLNFDYTYEKFIRRTKRLLSDNLSDMVPLYGSFRGTKTPATLYVNRRGEPVCIDFFDSDINPHGLLIGSSGSGKSFLCNDFIYQNYRLGSYFFVLDKGNSYRKTCDMLAGQYITFDMTNPMTINPFVGEPTNENLAFLVDMLSIMASGSDERDRLSREDKGFLLAAVQETYSRGGGKEIVLSDLIDVLNDKSFNVKASAGMNIGPRLALKLSHFTAHGQYGKFFDGKNEFKIGSRFTVFELANLSSHPDLQLVVLLNLMFFITNFVSDPKMLKERKFLFIDEAWQLLKMGNTADFISGAFKTYRKMRCSTLCITQEVNDVLQQKSGQAIIANTANKIFLKQENSVISQMQKELALSDEIVAALKSVKTVKGKYSEALIITPTSSGIVRLIPNPFLYWVASSEARDNDYLKDIQDERKCSLLEALKHCAKEYPYGIR